MFFYHGAPITGPWGLVSLLIGILITVIIISVFVRIIIRIVRGDRYCHHHRHWEEYSQQQNDPSSNARKILDERYAKGEISEEEYKRMRENLK